MSHSWRDDGAAKFAQLREYASERETASGKPCTIWLDKACIDQDKIEQSLAVLPLFLAGCHDLLVLPGASYGTRLWCIIELYVFLHIGGKRERMVVRPLDVSVDHTLGQFDAAQALPPGVTFQPDIGLDHYRPANDDTREDFINRLAYSKSYSEQWLSMRRQQQQEQPLATSRGSGISDECRSQPDFRPRTGRGPMVERNKDGLPIGEFLYESGRERAMQCQALIDEMERAQLSTPRMGDGSRLLFEEAKLRRYRELYEAITRRDPGGELRAGTLSPKRRRLLRAVTLPQRRRRLLHTVTLSPRRQRLMRKKALKR